MKFDSSYFENLKIGKIGDEEFYIPNNSKKILELMYGPDWTTERKDIHCKTGIVILVNQVVRLSSITGNVTDYSKILYAIKTNLN